MISFNEKGRLMELLPEFQLITDAADAAAVQGSGAVSAHSASEVLAAAELGLGNREIFYAVPGLSGVEEILGKCRLVANSMEDLVTVNNASAACGAITMVGLRLGALGFPSDAMTTNELRGLVHDIKQLKNISVCGCIVTGDVSGLHGKALGKYVRASYQTAKDMTYILPCTMPYIVVEDLLEAAARNEAEHPEDFQEFLTAANIVGMQNATAFYADYYIQ